jgi:hypothetical protein
MKRILDVGCGKEKVKVKGAKVIDIDRIELPGVDVIHDLEKTPLPFPDNYFDEIICNHVHENSLPIIIPFFRFYIFYLIYHLPPSVSGIVDIHPFMDYSILYRVALNNSIRI